MKKYVQLLLLLPLLSLTGCINILEEVWVNKDGTGKYSMSIDMSKLMEDGAIGSLLQMVGGKQDSASEKSLEQLKTVEMDSTFRFSSLPEAQLKQFEKKEIIERSLLHVLMSASKEKMVMTFNLDFKNPDEISYLMQNISKLNTSNDNGMASMLGQSGLLPASGANDKIEWQKKCLTRTVSQSKDNQIDEQTLSMMKMMFMDAKYKTIYHMPGKVKKAGNPNAKIEGQDVSIEVPMMDKVEGKAVLGVDIRYKN